MKVTYLIAGISVICIAWGYIWYQQMMAHPDCDKWLYTASSNVKPRTVEETLPIFKKFLPSQPYYATHKLPDTLEGYHKKYNLIPFETVHTVRNRQGKYVDMKVYDMLLAFAIGRDGAIYKYNQCGLLKSIERAAAAMDKK